MYTTIPKSIITLHEIFKANDKKLFLVGGCVRDFIMDKKPKDYDLATDATPNEVIKMMSGYRTNLQGEAFGVVVVYTEDDNYEIATFRSDIYGDKLGETRNPDIEFSTIEEDCKRRDITMSALFYDLEKQEIVDLVGGVDDIKNKVIRFVGDANLRIEEDPLRIMRAIRMCCRY